MQTNIYSIRYKLSDPITISFHTFTHREHVILESKGMIDAFGEATPFNLITTDTKQDNVDAFRHIGNIPMDKIQLEDIPGFVSKIDSVTSRAAVDMLLHDLIGKRDGLPTYKLYAKKRRLMPNAVTVWIMNPKSAKAKVLEIQNRFRGIKAVKVKLEGNKEDVARVKAVVDSCKPGMKFTLDANRGFTDKNLAIGVINEICDYSKGMVLVEEPYKFKSPSGLKEIRENVPIPVFGDETVKTLGEAKVLVESEAIDGINIKIQKMGGISESKRIAEYAHENGIKLMVGCMLETPLSISAGLHFAVSTRDVIITDLDTDLDLPDYFGTKPGFKAGCRVPNDGNGLGVRLDMAKFKAANDKNLIFEEINPIG